MALDRPRMIYRETHRLGYRYFLIVQVLPLLDRLTTRHMNTWIRYKPGNVIKCYVRDWVTIKMIFALTGWYSNVLHDVVVGIAAPAMEKILSGIPLYYYDVRHRLARHVTKLFSHGNIDDAE